LVQIERGTDYKAVVPISVEMTIDGLSGFTIGQIFTVNKDVLPKDYESKSVGFIVTGISNEVNTHSWTTTITSQMCLLDQDKRQKESLLNANAVLGELQTAITKNKADNSNSIRYYIILAGLVSDVLRNRFKVVNAAGDIETVSDPNYLIAALTEYGGGVTSLSDVVTEFNSAFLRQYPIPSIDPATQKSFRPDNINSKEVLTKTIKDMSFYKNMVNSLKKAFDSEFSKVVSDYYSNNFFTESIETQNIRSGASFSGVSTIGMGTAASGGSISFNLVSLSSVDEQTGLLVTPLKYVQGYLIYAQDYINKFVKK